ncbi:hypothetical protein [Sphingopyxis kveilinensis]|uniref:hypothetical protein n=1 Tax=Sphingopyxis kveilinensis TaxID=3114367 RepID=UPI0030D1E4D7
MRHYTELPQSNTPPAAGGISYLASDVLGIEACAMTVMKLPAHAEASPQALQCDGLIPEVFVVVGGSGYLATDTERLPLRQGMIARVSGSPCIVRAEAEGMTLILLAPRP